MSDMERMTPYQTDSRDPKTAIYLKHGNLSDSGQLTNLLCNTRPEEICRLGAQSHVRVSFDMPEYTEDITGIGTVSL